LTKRSLKHPGEEGSWEFTRLWHKLRPWPDSVEGIGMMKKKYVVATLSNGNVALLINMARTAASRGITALGRDLQALQADPESSRVVKTMLPAPHQ